MTSAPQRLRGQELLAAVAAGTAGAVGEEFLRCLARNVAEAFAAKLVLIAEADDPSGKHVRALVCWYDGAFMDEPFEYDTEGQPCAVITDYPWVSFPEALTERFPNDTPAVQLGLESYLAVCLRSSENVHLGHIAVLDARPMEAGEEDIAALRIFAARASAELERRNQARALEESRARVIEAADAERRRVGRDLHDGAQQRLLAVSNLLKVARMQTDAPARSCSPPRPRSSTWRTRICASWRAGCTRSRCRSAACGRRWSRCARRRRSEVVLDVTDDDLPDEIAAAAYFVAAESLANTARYAQAEPRRGAHPPARRGAARRGRRRRRRRRRPRVGHRPVRPRRPRRGAQGLLRRREPGRRGHPRPRFDPAGGLMPEQLHYTDSDEANALIASDPLALLIGLVLDQQVTVQKAFAGPLVLRERIGALDAAQLAATDLEPIFRERPGHPPLPGLDGQARGGLCAHIAEHYDGDAARVWTDATTPAELEANLAALPGFGEMKVTTLAAILAKHFDVATAQPLVPDHPTLGDVDSAQALAEYQADKRARKAAARAARAA